ncbi:TPA: hypothetical protein ACYTJX_004106, partial [Yersinia enterocolitica]
ISGLGGSRLKRVGGYQYPLLNWRQRETNRMAGTGKSTKKELSGQGSTDYPCAGSLGWFGA